MKRNKLSLTMIGILVCSQALYWLGEWKSAMFMTLSFIAVYLVGEKDGRGRGK